MKETLFKGKTLSGEWIIKSSEQWKEFPTRTEVIPNSIGEYFGLSDKNGTKIFSDVDIVKFNLKVELHKDIELIGVFTYNDTDLRYEIDVYGNNDYTALFYNPVLMSGFEIIGNTIDNPELLIIQ